MPGTGANTSDVNRYRRLVLGAIVALTAAVDTGDTWSTTPVPHISALMPPCAIEGAGDLVISVAGEHFQPGASVVLWNGSARPTETFPGTTTLLVATIFRGDLHVPGPAKVTVSIVDGDVRRSSPPITFDVVPAAGGASHPSTSAGGVAPRRP